MTVDAGPAGPLFGYLSVASARQASAHARAVACAELKAPADQCWFAVAAFGGGYFYELRAGASGHSHLPDLLDALREEPEGRALIPAGNRVYAIALQKGRPTGTLMSEAASAKLLGLLGTLNRSDGEDAPLGRFLTPTPSGRAAAIRPTRPMKRVRRAPASRFLSVAALAVLGCVALAGSASAWRGDKRPLAPGVSIALDSASRPSESPALVRLDLVGGIWSATRIADDAPAAPPFAHRLRADNF